LVKPEARIDMKGLFLSLQNQMIAKFNTTRSFVRHKSTKGTAAELNWLSMLNAYLPERYRADSAFVVDSGGRLSEQIDVVIYDRHYSPLLLEQDGALYVPAESVYAVFDVKHEMRRESILEAAQKAGSVRRLKRTTVPVKYVEGTYRPKELFEICAGILCLEAWWLEGMGASLRKVLRELVAGKRLDLGCAVRSGSFEATRRGKRLHVETSLPDTALIFFFTRLLYRLQQVGTVPAIDILKYAEGLKPSVGAPQRRS
jgi:hypothetical protein